MTSNEVGPAEQDSKLESGGQVHLSELLPDPRVLWMIFRRNLWLFLAAFIIVVAVVIGWTARQTPRYGATASLLVQMKEENVVDVKAVAPEIVPTTDMVDTEVRLMRSPELALRVAERYAKLHPDEAPDTADGLRDLADGLAWMVDISRVGSTFVIDVAASSSDREKAAEVANLFVTEFVAADKQAKIGANDSADQWLRSRTAELARDATAADQALQQYRISHGLLSSSNTTMAEQEISQLDSQVAQAQADLAEKSGRLSAARAQLRQGGGGADVGAALGSGTIGSLRAREAAASAEVAQFESRYGPLYPDLVKSKSQLADIRSQIQLEINRILSNLEADERVAASRLASLKGSRQESTSTLASNNAAQVGLQELLRRSDAAKLVYETFLKRLHETSAQQGLQQADTRVAQLAQVPDRPDFPNWSLSTVFALVGGLGAGFLSIGAAEYLRGGIRTKSDVERRLRVRYAGAVPTLQSTLGKVRAIEAPHDYILTHRFSNFAESLRALRTFLLLGSGVRQGRSISIAITSALPQEGKTTTSACLARTVALANSKTVLVDCDFRRHGSSDLFIAGDWTGIYDYLTGAKTLDEALVLDEASGLFILGTTIAPAGVEDILGPETVVQMLSELKQRFEVVILDTAPVLGIADARVIATYVDRVLMLARWRKTSIHACEAAIDLMLDIGAKICGVALTQVDINHAASAGHSEAFNYQKKFKRYYTN